MAPHGSHALFATYAQHTCARDGWCFACLLVKINLLKDELAGGTWSNVSTRTNAVAETFEVNKACVLTQLPRGTVYKCPRCHEGHHNCFRAPVALDGEIDDTKEAHMCLKNFVLTHLAALTADERKGLERASIALWEALRACVVAHVADPACPDFSVKKYPNAQRLQTYLDDCAAFASHTHNGVCFLDQTDNFAAGTRLTWEAAKDTFVAEVQRIVGDFRQRMAAAGQQVPAGNLRFGSNPTNNAI